MGVRDRIAQAAPDCRADRPGKGPAPRAACRQIREIIAPRRRPGIRRRLRLRDDRAAREVPIMPTLLADPQFKLYAICSVILSLEMLVLGGYTAATRAKHKNYLNPEDVAVSYKDAKLVEGVEHPDVARVQRAHRNLIESLPMFFALGLIYLLASASPLGAKICFGAFTGARVLHAIVYIKEMQPWRTVMYAIGALSLVGMMVLILMAVLA
jgi:prostaglandin-E synthase 1